MQSVVIIIVHTSVRLPPQAFAFTFWNYRFRFAQFSNFWVNSQAKWKQEKQPRCELLQYPGLPFLFIWLHQASRHLYKLMYNADGLLLLLILGCCSNNAVGMTFCGRKKKSHDLTDVHGCYITKTTWQWIFDLFKSNSNQKPTCGGMWDFMCFCVPFELSPVDLSVELWPTYLLLQRSKSP